MKLCLNISREISSITTAHHDVVNIQDQMNADVTGSISATGAESYISYTVRNTSFPSVEAFRTAIQCQ